MPGGHPTDYDPDFHPKDCIRLGREGKFEVQMARDWDVDVSTINNWRHAHPEFFKAYARAQQYRAAWALDKCQEGVITDKGSTFNATAIGMMLKYDGVQLDERFISMPKLNKAKTFAKKCDVIIKEFTDQKITYKEANAILDMIGKAAKIDEVTEMRKKLEEIELARKQGR